MTENHFFHKRAAGSRFSPLQINTQLFSFLFGSRFLPKSIGTSLYSRSVATSNMKLIGAFLIKLWSAQAFSSYFHILVLPIFSKIDRVLPLDTRIGVTVTWNTSLGVRRRRLRRRWRLRRRPDQNHNNYKHWYRNVNIEIVATLSCV